MNSGNWPRDKALRLRGIMDKLGLCPCGSSNDGFYRDKWFEFAAKVLDAAGLLEHGTAIGFAWLTDEGKLLLERE